MPIDNGLKTISDLFSGDRVFEIPIYQRPYAWGDQQVRDLLEDIRNLSRGKEHYFGTVLVKDSGQQHSRLETVDVVDGQQRLTTLQVLMSESIRRLEKDLPEARYKRLKERYVSVDGIPKLSPSALDKGYFQRHILEDEPYPDRAETPSQTRLKSAKKLIRDYLGSLTTDEAQQFLDRTEKLRVLVYTVRTDGEAALVFETTNDRGRPLTFLEKTKSFLMHQSYVVLEKPEPALELLSEKFADIYKLLDHLENNPILKREEDDILRYNFILFADWNSKKDFPEHFSIVKASITEMARKENAGSVADYIDRYSTSLRQVFTSVKEVLQAAQDASTDEGRCLFDILCGLGLHANIVPLLAAAWIEVRRNPTPESERDLLDLLRAIERFSFKTYVGGRRKSDTGLTDLSTLAWELYHQKKSVREARAALEGLGRNLVTRAQFEGTFRSETFLADSSTDYVKYLLWKYEGDVRVQSHPKEPLAISAQDIFSEKVEVEHILARNSPLPKEEKERYIDRLGNLALASKPANASMSDKPFIEKKTKYYSKSSFRMQQDLVVNATWGEPEIDRRTEALVQFAIRRWFES
ncbi:MAG: DUF262 domain-containing protein [Thermoplasmata archaeon]